MPSTEDFTYNEEKLIKKEFDHTQIYMAEVMDTSNIDKDGSIWVWVLNSGKPTKERKYWDKAFYCSPFYGTSTFNPKTVNTYGNSPTSFGLWMPIPFVGNYVFIFYPRINGGNVKPYWFGCPMDKDFNSMLPGMFNEFNNENGYIKKELNSETFNPLQKAIMAQGLTNDRLRGRTTSSSKRESPSMCYGFLSPLGHQFVIDDGWSEIDNKENPSFKADMKEKIPFYDYNWNSNLDESNGLRRYDSGFRLRTRNGAEILISDCGDIYAINCDGSAWAEITPYGELNGWAKKGVNIASDGNINLHSKQNVNIECDGKISMRAKENISIETPTLDISSINTNMDTTLVVDDIQSKGANIDILVSPYAQISGLFEGTLNGTSTYALSSGQNITSKLPTYNQHTMKNTPNITSVDEKTKSICNSIPTHEPWEDHNYNNKIKMPIVTNKEKEKNNGNK